MILRHALEQVRQRAGHNPKNPEESMQHLIAALMAFSLAACGGGGSDVPDGDHEHPSEHPCNPCVPSVPASAPLTGQ